MEKERMSYHPSVQKMYDRIAKDKITNVWDRYEAQGLGQDPDKRCPYCMGGVRCDFCSNGPCRADAEKDKRGVCGITADGMAMRMMALRNVMGASTYQTHSHRRSCRRDIEVDPKGGDRHGRNGKTRSERDVCLWKRHRKGGQKCIRTRKCCANRWAFVILKDKKSIYAGTIGCHV